MVIGLLMGPLFVSPLAENLERAAGRECELSGGVCEGSLALASVYFVSPLIGVVWGLIAGAGGGSIGIASHSSIKYASAMCALAVGPLLLFFALPIWGAEEIWASLGYITGAGALVWLCGWIMSKPITQENSQSGQRDHA